jgi:lysophospholipase L1-like esterase
MHLPLRSSVQLNCCLLFLASLLATTTSFCQTTAPDTTFRGTFYEQKRTLFESLPNTKKEIIFLGNSISDFGEWAELFDDHHIKNRGISGDLSYGVLARLGEVTASKPAKIFLLIGINDLARGIPDEAIIRNYRQIVQQIRRDSPRTRIYLQSVFPTNDTFPQFKRHQGKEAHIKALNDALRQLASENGQTYVDLHPYLADSTGKLDTRYTNDGLHLVGAGYIQWVKALRELGHMK